MSSTPAPQNLYEDAMRPIAVAANAKPNHRLQGMPKLPPLSRHSLHRRNRGHSPLPQQYHNLQRRNH